MVRDKGRLRPAVDSFLRSPNEKSPTPLRPLPSLSRGRQPVRVRARRSFPLYRARKRNHWCERLVRLRRGRMLNAVEFKVSLEHSADQVRLLHQSVKGPRLSEDLLRGQTNEFPLEGRLGLDPEIQGQLAGIKRPLR